MFYCYPDKLDAGPESYENQNLFFFFNLKFDFNLKKVMNLRNRPT